ncbi:MAG: helix-turn-helix domain-containing protein [Bacteroides sp.]|nr:helix-turn-helix domain-containing protein [Bacteroides sp.]
MATKKNFEVIEGCGSIKIRDPKTTISIEFKEGEPQTLRGDCEDLTKFSSKIYLNTSRALVDFAYQEGYLEFSDAKSLRRREARRALGASLRAAREAKGYSIRDVEEATGVTKAVISRTEGGRANTTIDTINDLAEFYGLRVDLVK